MRNAMPRINIEALNLNHEDMAIVKLIVKSNGSIRSTKPHINDNNPITGKAAYIWRMIAFSVSKNPVHHCMPITATFDLPAFGNDNKWSSALASKMAKELKHIENEILGQIPKIEWYGITRWGRSLGYL